MDEFPMPRAEVVREKIVERDTVFLSIYIETRNACLMLLSEGEDKLGTLAVAIPQAQEKIGPPVSSILLGNRNVMIARVLAERLAEKMGKIALVSVFSGTSGVREVGPTFLKLVRKTIKMDESER